MYPRHLSPAPLSLRRFSDLNLRLITAGLLVGLVLCATAGFARTQNASSPGSSPPAARLTQDLVTLNARYHRAGSVEQARLLNDLLTAAAARQRFLASLIEDNPGEVLQVALPAAVRANLPPAVRDYVEQEVGTEGELQVLIEDYPEKSRTLYFLESAGERLSLHFAANPPKHLLSGAQIRLKGVRVDGALALASGDTSLETLALDPSGTSTTTTTSTSAVVPNTLGEQKTLAILVNFQDNPTLKPWTIDQVRSLLFGTVSNFYLENSFQQTWLTGDVYGWYTVPLNSTTCDEPGIANYAKQAATAAGINLSAYTHYVYMFPNSSCQWLGKGTVGGNPSQAWINGDSSLRVVGHEFGHNLGLWHSHGLYCNTSPLGDNCHLYDYGDRSDAMGGRPVHFNAFQKERLGWLNNGAMPPIMTVQISGNYTLDPYESNSPNPKALKILKSTDPNTRAKTWYYLEYRQALGFDSFLNGFGNLVSGVQVRTGSEDLGVGSNMLNMNPDGILTDFTQDNEALSVGGSFTDSTAGVTIAVPWANSTGAGVSVIFSQPSCVHANPAVTLSPSSQSAQAGTALTYTVSVANNDNSGCSASSFNLQATVPGGWSASFAAPTLTLSPGASTSTTLTVSSPVASTAGSYTIGAKAANGASSAYATTATATYSIVSGLATTVSTDKASYAAGDTVTTTGTATSGGKPVANASVTFTITKPNGAIVNQTAATNTNGQAVYKLRLSRQKDPAGVYQARAVAASNGQTASASTSFTVQ